MTEQESSRSVQLSGVLVCASEGEAAIVERHLPLHISLTRAEPGCVSFEVVHSAEEPMIWNVDEVFCDSDAFRAHQKRVAASEWGSATAGIERRYEITGLVS